MLHNRLSSAILSASLLLGGCSFSADALWPSLSGTSPSGDVSISKAGSNTVAIKPSEGEKTSLPLISVSSAQSPPKLGNTNFQVKPPRSGPSTGTFVGAKISQLRDDLSRLQASVKQENVDLQTIRKQTNANAKNYHGGIAPVRSKLQLGTTPGNPLLIKAWNKAQVALEKVNVDIGKMNALSNRVAADAAMSTYLLEATRASFGISGAIDEDHQQLELLEDDVNQTVVLIDRLLTELSDDIRRQSNYVSNERSDLNTLALAIKNGEFFGPSLASTAYTMATGQSVGRASVRSSSEVDSRRALIVIRFDRPDVNFQQALYTAVNRVLQRQPAASFDLVAVSSLHGGAAKSALNTNVARRNAQKVLRSLVDMGLPPSRVVLSARASAISGGNEVRIYIR